MPTTTGLASSFITFSRASGATVTDSDGKIKWAGHNLVLNSASPATQTITVVVGLIYTVQCTGSGSVALSGAGTGTVSAGSPVTITASTTSLTLTVSGSVSTMWAYRSGLGGMALNPETGTTYYASSGSILNAPRLDYDPVTLAAKGLLVEEQRTNLLLQSHNASSSPWSAFYAYVTPNAAVSPFGTMTASKIVENTTNNVHILSQSVSVATGSYTFSCYLKPAGRSFSQIIWQDATPSYFSAFFDLANGVVSSTGANTTATIMPAGDGWWRCSITGTSSTGGTGGVTIRTAISSNSSSYTGDGTSGLYFGGAQFEAGSFATSYIPTTSTSVTRSADVASVATSAFPYNASAGTIIINGTTPDANSVNPGGGVPALVAFTDQTINNRIQLIRSASGNNMVYGVFSGGSSQASLTTTTSWSNNTTNKVAAAWASDDFAVAFQTDAILTDTSGLLPVGITKLNIASRDGTSYWCGWIRQITYIPRRLTNAELQARTA